ncbi:MAG: CotH kinase family protein [Bacteroides sp.]|nr:CotH kinase family protein [Bacteroides sp.]
MKKVIVLAIVITVGIAAGIGLVLFPQLQEEQQSVLRDDENVLPEAVSSDPLYLAFSHTDTFYDETIPVEITCKDSSAEIYYSLDGSTPDASSKKYTEPIIVKAGNTVSATTIKAVAISGNETSELQTKSYVTGKNVFERFDESTYIFVLSTDPYNLYDYYNGVCVEGYVRDQWLENEYRGGEIPYDAPANWFIGGRESERDMYVEVYDSRGNQLIDQAAGGRVVGGVSRAVDQKSWRLIARNEYSEGNGKFKYPFFGAASDSCGELISRYDRITLRNNANDREFASIRDEVANQLAKNAGFPDTQDTIPAAVFLNGKYYGFSWLHEAYCSGYLEMMYGGNRDNFRIVGHKETELDENDDDSDYYDIQSSLDYSYVCELAKGGLTDDGKFEEFCSLVDIDNLMLYYSIQIYINNEDWPGNNFKAWRYYPEENEELENPYLDGKWRFLLFDAEYGMGLYGNGYREPTLSYLINGGHMGGTSTFLTALLEREDMKMKLANTVCDLMYGEFSYENALKVIDEKIALCDTECMYALDNGYTSNWARRETFEESRQQIRDFFKNRPEIMLKDLKNVLGYEKDMINVALINGEGGSAYLNSAEISGGERASRNYFSACSVPIRADEYIGYSFLYWDINGTKYETKTAVLTSDMAEDGNITVKAVYEKTPVVNEEIYISRLYTSGDSDSITLYNPNSVDVKLNGYCLSDKASELDRWEIPSVVIKAESELTVVCRNNNDTSALQKLVTNFNLKTGEVVYLSNPDNKVISTVAVVDMEENRQVVRRSDGKYVVEEILG